MMMLKKIFGIVIFCAISMHSALLAESLPPDASVNGKYANLIQILTCPQDSAKYGNFKDYGYWKGGPWCGQTGKAGYWVWVAPKWYVWADKGSAEASSAYNAAPPEASVNGKYINLIQVINCPQDAKQYGDFKDYGYWKGGLWCGQTGKAGYWVWVAPDWYVWANRSE